MYNSSFFAFSLLSIFAGINVEGVSIGRTSGQLESVDAQVPGLGTYRGVHITDNIRTSVLGSLRISNVKQPIGDNLTAPVLAWLGIDYVKQPTGDLRFRPPQKLDVYNRNLEDRVINATQYGVICPQAGLGAFWPMGEGCLSLNIYRPAGITLEKKLPVAFYIHGVSNYSTLILRSGLRMWLGYFQPWCWPYVQWSIIRGFCTDSYHDGDYQLPYWSSRLPPK